MENNFIFLGHACIKFNFNNLVVYTDPYDLNEFYNDADIIFITHGHYDHYSVDDIKKVMKENTIVVLPKTLDTTDLLRLSENITIVSVTQEMNYTINNLNFETVPAYNIEKTFHPKVDGGVGYILEFNNVRYYIAGDTDITEENRKVKCDAAFVPVGGKYTMNYSEAAQLVNELSPKFAVPIHYGKVVGSKEDAVNFKKLINAEINCIVN